MTTALQRDIAHVEDFLQSPSGFLRHLFSVAVNAVDPMLLVPQHLPPAPKGRTIVIGAGKASARMALAVERYWTGSLEGLVVTRYGHGEPCEKIEIAEAGHPVPDSAGEACAKRMLGMLHGLTSDDLVIALISGGGSALLSLPADGLSSEEKRKINKALLLSGATIQEMNCVRSHLSQVKGGRLAMAAFPAKVVTLVVSDVPGDDPGVVASGPTIPNASAPADALAILDKYAIPVSDACRKILQSGSNQAPASIHAQLGQNTTKVIATAQQALDAATRAARNHGYTPLVLGNSIEGEARDIALMHAAIARQIVEHKQPIERPCVILSGGETTVTVRGNGRGGRNAEFLLSLGIGLNGMPDVYAIACDTDGIDGTEDNAGCLLSPNSLARARAMGLSPRALLQDNDGYGFFRALGDLIVTGPTRTNVNDFRAILIR
ncbi:glycerate kinase type-2 family protein [Noviherbaspirillum galbum]|uniref:Glycerate kinase n=1 Tax=Noviherbaspirillum galbum TaxID=2709383 RepID=A0A6B3SRJ8_9BURK|nr:glycerate kinase [Noviherbaspirillum galbum]NEX61965.1 glycerate kinase [Noviherbaspirillum galbum]